MAAHIRDGIVYEGNTVNNNNLEELNDVNLTNIQDGQTLKYDNKTGTWVNGNASVVANLEDLQDVTLTDVKNKQTLIYDIEKHAWINSESSNSSITMSYEEYMQLSPEEKAHGEYFVPDYPSTTTATIEDGKISLNSIWSSEKTNSEIAAVSDKIGTVPSGQTVENQITAINSKLDNIEDLTNSAFDGVLKMSRIGHIIHLTGYIKAKQTVPQWTTVFYLPKWYSIDSNSVLTPISGWQLKPSGAFQTTKQINANEGFIIDISYVSTE